MSPVGVTNKINDLTAENDTCSRIFPKSSQIYAPEFMRAHSEEYAKHNQSLDAATEQRRTTRMLVGHALSMIY